MSNNANKLALSHHQKKSAGTFYSKGSGNFNDLTNWASNYDGTGANPNDIADGTGIFIIQTGHTVVVNSNINIQTLTINGALEIGNDNTQRILTLVNLNVAATTASVYTTSSGSSPHILKISGSINNSGSINLYNAGGKIVNTEFNGENVTITGVTPIFNNVTFKTGTTTPSTALDIRGDVSIEDGATFADGDLNHSVKGNWSESGTGARTGKGTITFNGSSIISTSSGASNPIVFNHVNFSGGGTYTILENVTVNGNFTVTSTSNVIMGNSSNTLFGDFTVEAGSTYTQTSNFTYFNSTNPQTITATGNVNLYNVTFNNGSPNEKTATGSIAVTNTLTISTGATLSGTANWNITNGLQVNGTCNLSGVITMKGGTISGTSPVSLGTANLNVSGSVWVGAITLNTNNDVTIQSGYLVINTTSSLTGQAGNTLSVSDNATLYIRGTNNFPSGFGSYNLSSNSTVRYDWNINQTIRGGITYGNLLIDDNGSTNTYTKTADGLLNLTNNLYLYGATNLDLKSQDLTLGGSIYNGTNSSIINSGTISTVALKGSDISRYIQTAGTGSYNFGNLVIDLENATTTRYTYIQSDLTVKGNFTVTNPSGSTIAIHILDMGAFGITNGTAGKLSLGPYCQINTTATDFGAIFMDKYSTRSLDANSTVWYSLNGDQQIAAGQYGAIWFNGGNKTAKGPLDINGNIAINGGIPVFFDHGFTHTLAGNWGLGAVNYTQTSASGTIILDGINQSINTSNFNHLSINNKGIASFNGNLNLYGNLSISNGATLDANVYNLNIDGNFTNNGLFTQSAGTTTFEGPTKQQLNTNAVSNFFNLVINKPGTTTDAQTLQVNSAITATNNISLSLNAGILDLSGNDATIGGNLDVSYNALGTNLLSTNSDILFNGDVVQNITNQNNHSLVFKNITFTGAGSKTFAYRATTYPLPAPTRMVEVNGNVSIKGCTVNGGSLDFQVSGNWSNSGTFTHNSSDTVFFDGTDQTISSSSFSSVVFSNSGAKTLNGNISLSGNLAIRDAATLDPNNNTISLAGNWINTDVNAQFKGTSGTVIFKGNASAIKSGTSTGPLAGKSFYNVTVNKNTGQTLDLNGDLEVTNDFTIDGGIFRTLTYDMWIGGNFQNNGGVFQHNYINSVLTLNGTGGTKNFNPGSTLTNFWGIIINAPGTVYSVANDFNIQSNGNASSSDLIISSGALDLGGHTLKILSPNQKIQINTGGNFTISAGSTLSFSSYGQSIVNNGGILNITGTPASIANVNNIGSSTYTIVQNSGGTIHAQNYKFDNIGGITINTGSFIDATDNFSNGTFAGGSGTAYLTLNNDFTPFTATNVVFNNGPTNNVSRPGSASGKITFQDYSGTLSGAAYELDPSHNLIDWTTTTTGIHWTGGANTTDWHTGNNWSTGQVPDITSNVYLDHSSVGGQINVDISTGDALCRQIIIDATGGPSISLNLKSNKNLTVNGNLIIGSSTTLNASESSGNISIAGNWSNMGTFNHGNSSVLFNGTADNFTITTGGSGTGKSFYNLLIDAEGATYALTQPLDADNNLTVQAGTFNLSSPANYLNVGGNWSINSSATFIANSATVTFDGADQSISGGSFYNFITAGSGTKTLSQNTAINGTLTIGASTTLNAQTKDIYVAGNLTNNGGTFSQSGTGTFYFDGSGTQQINNGTTPTTFNHIILQNSGPKYFNKDIQVNGDLTINTGSGTVDLLTNQITGTSSHSFSAGASTYIQIRGNHNFPTGFGTFNLTPSSTVEYIADIDQTITMTTNWSYGNLRLSDLTSGSAVSTKTVPSGNLVVKGNVYISDNRSILDMATNSANMTLTGGINYTYTSVIDPSAQSIKWGTGSSTLTWIGQSDWNIDRNITRFNNVIFAGTGSIYLYNNLAFDGDLTVKNGVNLQMYEYSTNDRLYHIITGSSSKSFTLENGSTLYCPTPSTVSPAIPQGFSAYTIGPSSTVFLNSHEDQTLYTGNNIVYGNLRFLHAKTITSDGIALLNIDGYFNADSTIFNDGNKNISIAGPYAYLNFYTPSSPSVKITLDGNTDQVLYDNYTSNNNQTLDLGAIEFSGSGTKTLGDSNDNITISGDLTVNSGVTLSSSSPITFSGQNWTNKGVITHTSTLTFDSSNDQTIDPGPANSANYLTNLIFSNNNKKTFVNHGADINGNITINGGTTELGGTSGLTHKLNGSIYYSSGTLSSATANLILDGYNQDILSTTDPATVSPTFTINNITMATGGTKRMFSDWTINGDLTINYGCYLNTSNNTANPSFSNIFIKGNWNNNGYYTNNSSTVTFGGNAAQINITSNNSNFYHVVFTPSTATEYKLLSPITRFSCNMELGSLATLNLNSQSLILGSNIAPVPSTDPPTTTKKIFNVSGTLKVNENSFLRFNNQGTQCVLDILSGGKLSVTGSDNVNIGTISHEVPSYNNYETKITIESGGNVEAKYYLIEYLGDGGLYVKSGAHIDAVNNFSYGRWANARNANGISYLNIEAEYTGTITNINFDFPGTPTIGNQYNIRRNSGTGTITLKSISGNLNTYNFEDDQGTTAPSPTTGLLLWEVGPLTNWTGAINTDWHNAGNWDNGVPDATKDAVIPDKSNDPHITKDDAVCNNLTLTNGLLYLENGKKLETKGDILIGTDANSAVLMVESPTSDITAGGSWINGTNGIFMNGNGTVRFTSSSGASTIIPRNYNFYNLTIDNPLTSFYLTGSAITINGSVTVKNGILTPATTSYLYTIEKDFVVEAGRFNHTGGGCATGSVSFNGTGGQNITNATFYNLAIAGTGTKTTHGNITVANSTVVYSSLKAETGSSIDFNGDVTITATGSFDDGGQTHYFSGVNWTGTGAYIGTGTVIFDKIGSQNIYDSKFNNLDLNSSASGVSITLLGNISVTGNVFVRNTITYLNILKNNIINTSKTGTFQVDGASNIYITGYDNFPVDFLTYTLSPLSYTRYQGNTPQLISAGGTSGISYGNLYLNGANTKTLKGNITVQNSLTFNNSTLDVSTNNYTLTILGPWYNNANGSFLCRKGNVIFTGPTPWQGIYSTLAGNNDFYNLSVDKTSGYAFLANNTPYRVINNLKVSNGIFHANSQTITVEGDMLANGGGTFARSGTYCLKKASGTANIQTNNSQLYNLTINGGATFVPLDDLRADGNFNLMAGTFDGNGKRIALGWYGNTLTISGYYRSGAGGSLEIGASSTLTVNPSGTIEIVGTSDNNAAVTRNLNYGAGYYSMSVAGTIKAKYALFEWMASQANGIQVTGNIDPSNNFSYCTFSNCPNNGAMLSIENTQDNLNGANRIVNASFPINPGGNSSNVRKISQKSGTVEFYNASGVFSGEAFDDDPSNLINWNYPVTLTWNGSQSTDWFTAMNWTPNFVPAGDNKVIIAPAVNQPVINKPGAVAGSLLISPSAALTVDYASGTGLEINGDLTINGTFNLNSGNRMTLEGNWTKGTIGNTVINGDVTFNGSQSSTINNGNFPFYNLIISGTANYKLVSGSIVKNDLTITPGSSLNMDAGSFITIGGNWTNNGVCKAQTSNILFNASSGNKTILPGNSNFYTVTINGIDATYQIGGNLTVTGNLNIQAGTLNLNGFTLNAGDGSGSDNIFVNGTLTANGDAKIRMGASSFLQVNNGGILNLLGTDGHPIIITHQSTGTYAFDINNGGTLAARYYTIEYTNTNGLYFHSGAKLDPANNLTDGTFSYGTGTYLKFENDFNGTSPVIANVKFNIGPQYNVTRKTGTDYILFKDASGYRGYYLYENDLNGEVNMDTGLLHWTYPNSRFWTGTVDNDWHNANNWQPKIVPDATMIAVIPGGVPHYPIISQNTASVKSINLFTGDSLRIEKDLTIADELINQGAIIGAGNPLITISGDWTGPNGSFRPGQSKVLFNANSGPRTINFGNGAFYNFEINAAPTVNYLFSASDTILNDLTLTSGSLDCTSSDLTIGGNWSGSGTFIPGEHTVTFNAITGIHTLDAGANNFYNLSINSGNGTGNATIASLSPLTITNNFSLQKGTFDLSPDGGTTSNNLTIKNRLTLKGGTLKGNNADITAGENWIVIAPGAFACGTSRVTLTSPDNNIVPGASPFYDLIISADANYRLSNHVTINHNLTINGTLASSSCPSYNIQIAGDWNTTGTFVPEEGTVIFNGTTQNINNTADIPFYHLITHNTQLNLNCNVTVSDTLEMASGNISTGNYRLTLGNQNYLSYLNYTSGRIFGQFERWVNSTGDFLFPVGSDLTNEPLTFKNNNIGHVGSIIAEFKKTDPSIAIPNGLPLTEGGFDITTPFNDGYWLLSAANEFISGDYNISITANGFNNYTIDRNTRIIERSTTTGSLWTLDGSHKDGASPTCYRNGLSNTIAPEGTIFALAITDCNGGQIASDQLISLGNDVDAFTSITDAQGGTNYAYSWLYSTDTTSVPGTGTWVDISDSNTAALDYGTLNENRSFVRKVSGTGCKTDRYSNVIKVTICQTSKTGTIEQIKKL